MKILHISHSRENTGIGESIRNYQRAMIAVGLDVVSRPVMLNSSNYQLEDDLFELEQKSSKGCDVVIQHILPRYMSYNGNFKNIGYFVLETKGIHNSSWVNNLNLMDEVWTPNTDTILCNNGITTVQKLVPHTCNIEEYKVEYKRLPDIENTFNFYFVGEFSRRKNIAAILKAFHLEFRHEPVNLILKVNKPGYNPTQLFNEVKDFCNKIKEGLKFNINQCKSEIVITDRLSRKDLLSLHRSCNCFLNTSFGEAWPQPIFDAVCMGNLVISSNNGAPKDYLPEYKYGFLVDGIYEPVFGNIETVPEIYTGNEQWFSININELRQVMRKVYEEKFDISRQRDAGLILAEKYSYEKVGNLIKDILNES